MGVAAVAVERRVALVFCQGGVGKGVVKYRYAGAEDAAPPCSSPAARRPARTAASASATARGSASRTPSPWARTGSPSSTRRGAPAAALCAAECPRRGDPASSPERGGANHIRCSSHDRGPAVKKALQRGLHRLHALRQALPGRGDRHGPLPRRDGLREVLPRRRLPGEVPQPGRSSARSAPARPPRRRGPPPCPRCPSFPPSCSRRTATSAQAAAPPRRTRSRRGAPRPR